MTSKENNLMTFSELFDRWNWKPIRNCPGRFVFAAGASELTVEQICQSPVRSIRFFSEVAPDEITIVKLETGGGLISYLKADRKFLHTLCDEEGFARKTNQLGL